MLSTFNAWPKLSLLSNDIKKAQEQQIMRDDIQDRAALDFQANLTESINDIQTDNLRNITYLSSKVIKNSLGRLWTIIDESIIKEKILL